MKRTTLMGIFCLLLVGCDYTVSLVDSPSLDMDKSVVGLWKREKDDGQTEELLVLPLDGCEYMISFPAGTTNAMFARACLWRGSEKVLVQLEWFGTAQGKLPEDNRKFQYASYAVDDDSIAVRLLNPKVAPKNITSAKALAKAIADNKDHPNLFRDEMIFQKRKE